MISEELINHLPEVFFDTTADGYFASVSSYAIELLGYSHEELLTLPIRDLFVDPQQRDRMLKSVLAMPGESVCQQAEVRCRDGRYLWLELRVRGQFDSCGRYIGEEGIAHDITEQKALLRQLQDSEDRFRRLSDVAREAIFIHHNGRFIDCNQSAEAMFGYSHGELIRMEVFDLVARSDVEIVRANISRQSESPYTVHGRRVDGSTFPMEIYSKQSKQGELDVRVSSVRDLSERFEVERRAHMLSEAMENCPVAVIITDADGKVAYVNTAVSEMTGFQESDLRALPHLADMFCLKLEPDAKWLRWKLTMGQSWSGRLKLKRADGQELCVIARLTATHNEKGDVLHQSLVLEDITLQQTHEETIRRQAQFDQLTDLPNRVMAAQQMETLLEDARETETQAALLFVDLDEFKTINDSLGHDYGDALLQAAAERMQLAAGRGHCIARFGGDEFLVMVGGLRASTEVEALAERLVNAFASPFDIRSRELIATVSVGVALYPLDGSDFTTLLRNADTAMSQAKKGGKNGFCFFNSEMNRQAEMRLKIEGQLRRVLERNELSLHYQPVIDFETGQLKGAEALLRWHSQELGFVPPDQFIPLAENSGQIVPIGTWVLNTACQQAKQWQEQFGIPLRIAVNVSPRQFKGGDLIETVTQALLSSGLPAHCLEIEVTEGLLLTHRAETRRIFRALKAMGVRIAIDDFGTGYSSLAYLEKFSFNTLKIDKSFVAGMTPGSRRDTLVKTIITMAHGLELKVVAEGVETPQQVERLSSLGCDFAQGYHFSKPLTTGNFKAFLSQRLTETAKA